MEVGFALVDRAHSRSIFTNASRVRAGPSCELLLTRVKSALGRCGAAAGRLHAAAGFFLGLPTCKILNSNFC